VAWKGYGSDDDEWIKFEDISLEIIQDFWSGRNYSNTLSNEDPVRKTRSVTLEKPPSQLCKLKETEFSPSVPTTNTSPPLLPTLQKISLMFS